MEQARQATTRVTVHFPGETGTGTLCNGHPDLHRSSRNLLTITCPGCLTVLDEALDRDEVVISPNGAIAWRDIGICETP